MTKLFRNRIIENDIKEIYNCKFIDWNVFKDCKFLITGSTGLIGSQIVNSLIYAAKENEYKIKLILPVRNLKKAKKYYKSAIKDGYIKLYKYNINKKIRIKGIEKIDHVIHCANNTSSKYFTEKPIKNINEIINGTKNLLNYVKNKNIKSFIYLSSMEIYGQFQDTIEGGTKEENLGYINISDTRSSYSEGKRVAELICYSFFKEHNIPVKIVRLGQIIGANASINDKRIINYFASCIVNKKDIILNTNGEKIRSYCYITDVITGIFKIMTSGANGETYNIANKETLSIKDITKNLCKKYNINYKIQIDENINKIYHKVNWCILNTDKLEKLGWKANVDLNESFGRLISSFYWQEINKNSNNNKNKYSIIEKIFSIKNNKTHKVICIFGLKIKLPIKLRNRFYCWFYRTFYGIKRNKIVFCNFFGDGYGCNPKYIIEEINKHGLKYDIVWLNNLNCNLYDGLPNFVRKVNPNNKKYLFEISTAKFWIFNIRSFDYTIRRGIKKHEKQIYIQTWHGSLGIKKIGNTTNMANEKRRIKWFKYANQDMDSVNYFLSNSTFEISIIKSAMYYNREICLFGHPRNDIFFRNNPNLKEKIASMYKFNKNLKIALYVPSFRDDFRVDCYSMEYEKLLTFLNKDKNEWILLIRFHPNVKFYAKLIIESKENIIDVSLYPDIQELLYIADIAITDYSSCIFDFMLSKKPGFIFATDIEKYNNDRGFYYPLEETPFPIARNTDELIKNIENFDREKYEKEVEDFIKSKGCMEDGHASERVVDLIENIVNGTNKN